MKLSDSATLTKDLSGSTERVNRRLLLMTICTACKVQSQQTHYQIRGRQTNGIETILQRVQPLLPVMSRYKSPQLFPLLSRRSRAGERLPCSAGTNTLWNFVSALANSSLPAPQGEPAQKELPGAEKLVLQKASWERNASTDTLRHPGTRFLKHAFPANLDGHDFTITICSEE